MRRLQQILSIAAAASFAGAASVSAQTTPMLGFSPAGAAAQRNLEARFDAGLSAGEISDRLRRMASLPNQVGSPHDKENAEFTLDQFKSWGWDAHIEVFSVLYPTPTNEVLELVGPEPFRATLTEPPIPGDATSARTAGALPAYNIYGADGDVTAPLVYVNYGMPEDYKTLERLGVDVKGKIVIARYGGGWRGLKPKLAWEHGAVGCIIYSDPADDGYGAGDPYPIGAWRPEHGIQRGSVLDMPVEAGDPLTPGIGATVDAPRIPIAEAKTILHIPVLPISWGDAQHFLAALSGPVAPKNWRGALPLTYHVGPGGRAHLLIASDWSQKPLYDVIATIKGAQWPDEWVIRGNHRDGWVFGAQDPLAGQTALMEEARSIGALAKTGWRPKRTLVYASWDGEEPGLLGSTEWAETHAAELQAKAVLYVNSDTNDRGLLQAQASYSTRRLIDQAGADVKDPETGASVRDRSQAATQVRALAPDATDELKALARAAAAGGDFAIGDLGSGSDYTAFVQHLGIASINLGYGGGEGKSAGVYHSAYDTFEHYQRFGDPGMVYGVVLAKTAGRLVLRTADADLIPLQFANFAARVGEEVGELERLLASERERTATLDRLIDQKAFFLAADPTEPWGAPAAEAPVPALDFAPLDAAVARLTASAKAYDKAAAAASASPERLTAANAVLQGAEQAMTDPAGLPGRPWYKHLIYAPGMLTGYGSKTLPGVREAIEGRRWGEATDYIARTARALAALADRLDAAAKT